MALEIERKFLVDPRMTGLALRDGRIVSTSPVPTPVPRWNTVHQVYLSADPDCVVRVRKVLEERKAFVTVKGRGHLVRPELEWSVPFEDAEALFQMAYSRTRSLEVRKIRMKVDVGRHVWDLDVFGAEDWMAEVELAAADEPFERPSWAVREVTEDSRFSNAWIAEHGFPRGP